MYSIASRSDMYVPAPPLPPRLDTVLSCTFHPGVLESKLILKLQEVIFLQAPLLTICHKRKEQEETIQYPIGERRRWCWNDTPTAGNEELDYPDEEFVEFAQNGSHRRNGQNGLITLASTAGDRWKSCCLEPGSTRKNCRQRSGWNRFRNDLR